MGVATFRVVQHAPDCAARAGVLTLPHGTVETPAFIPVGTLASVKGLTPDELVAVGAQIVLANTYHLYLRPGAALVERLGGLHRFMAWPRPLLTDSGGFQVFSLGFGREQGVGKIAKIFPAEEPPPRAERVRAARAAQARLVRIDDDGVEFTSHLDGSLHRLTPEHSIAIQEQLGADIILAFDECTSPLAGYEYTRQALERTHRWARRCLAARRSTPQALFGIVQGGEYRDLREHSARTIASLPFDGVAIGGSLGQSKADMHRVLEWTVPLLPPDWPRHLLGIGEPEDLIEGVRRGIDLFDCVAPTRHARHGVLYVPTGRLHIERAEYRADTAPVQADCDCYTCTHFSRAYLRHLFLAGEMLGPRLATVHNLRFLLRFMAQLRHSILEGGFTHFASAWLSRWRDAAG
ncbi:MAG TPA: tRNA guanosine(34) transglycosylase Tgt [Chloroflexota bacterium]|jgi:queuine tRNA-ribosyltransferase|nr:tRNA guanosine(34) transglycosylase Tgt [Chloroflexota bacterium]